MRASLNTQSKGPAYTRRPCASINLAVQHRLPRERTCAMGGGDGCADGCAELFAGPAVVESASFLAEGG